MKYIVVIIWAVAIGQVVAFIGARLLGVNDNVAVAAIVSAIFGLAVTLIEKVAVESPKTADK